MIDLILIGYHDFIICFFVTMFILDVFICLDCCRQCTIPNLVVQCMS